MAQYKYGARHTSIIATITQPTSKPTLCNALCHQAWWQRWEDLCVLYCAQEACPPGHCQAFSGGGEVVAKCCGQTTCEHCQSFQVGGAKDQQNQYQSSRHTLQENEEGGQSWLAQPVDGNQRTPALLHLSAPQTGAHHQHICHSVKGILYLDQFL
jgi:hypothetical protein